MRVLFLSRWFPHPPDNGSRQRVLALLQQLSARATVDLISMAQDEVGPERIAALKPFCAHVEVIGEPERAEAGGGLRALLSPTPRSLTESYSPEFAAAVERAAHAHTYDLVLASELTAAGYGPAVDAPLRMADALELTLVRNDIARQSGTLRRLRAQLAFQKHARYCGRMAELYDLITVVSTPEQKQLQEWAAQPGRVQVLPNAIDATLLDRPAPTPQPQSLIYAGALTFDANFDAVQWFLAAIYPQIRAALPGASFTVTGKTEGVALDALTLDPSVRFSGWTPDIHALVAQHALSVVPLRLGGGTRLKILESMALGVPVVATAKGAEGLDVVDGRHLLLADDPTSFAQAVVRLLRAPDERARLATAARAFVQEHHTWPQVGERLMMLIEQARAAKSAAKRAQGAI